MKILNRFINWLFTRDIITKESIDKELSKIELTLTKQGYSQLRILQKQREYLDYIDKELDYKLLILEGKSKHIQYKTK